MDFNDDLKVLAEEMLLVMYAADGIGLAAPQLGINKRLMVFNGIGMQYIIGSTLDASFALVVHRLSLMLWIATGFEFSLSIDCRFLIYYGD